LLIFVLIKIENFQTVAKIKTKATIVFARTRALIHIIKYWFESAFVNDFSENELLTN